MSPSKSSIVSMIRTWTPVAPLLAAVLAPFSVLFDIPALTEPWFVRADPNVLLDPNKANSIPDHTVSLALSGIGLGFNIIANALLIVRFSTTAQWWRIATRLSLVFWVSKVIIALVNLCVFGRVDSATRRGEGLWCAVVSLILSSLITFLLLCHWGFEFKQNRPEKGPTDDQLTMRVAGRHFMLNVTLFVVDLALLALLGSRVEHWTYLQGIYYATVTLITIGFGDFYPTHTVTRILLFFFAIIGIAQLGNIISMLVGFFGSRAAEKRAISRAEFERARQEEEEGKPGVTPDLIQEIEFLHRLGEQQETRTRVEQLVKSLVGLLVFWVVGAAIFSQLEGWAYGTGIYVLFVVFLTIGYGEFAPITPAGRVVFVLYSLIAVPVMASFAVQAVQQVFAAFSERQYDRAKAKKGLTPDPQRGASSKSDMEKAKANEDRIVPHSELAEQWHRDWERQLRRHREEGFSEGDARKLADEDTENQKNRDLGVDADAGAGADADANRDPTAGEREFDEDAQLTERILQLALSLESRARKLLIMHLGDGSGDGGEASGGRAARILLKADRNVQLREVRGLVREIEEEQAGRGEDQIQEKEALDADRDADKDGPLALNGVRSGAILKHILHDDPDEISFPSGNDEQETMDEVRRYREDFAGLLAAGSRLMGLKGNERALFERRRLRDLKQDQAED